MRSELLLSRAFAVHNWQANASLCRQGSLMLVNVLLVLAHFQQAQYGPANLQTRGVHDVRLGSCRTWVMLYGLDVGIERQLIVVGDSKGRVYFVDARSEEKIFQGQLHKKGMKVATFWAAACVQTPLEL